MAVIAIVQSAESIPTLVDHAVWAASLMKTSIRFVALSPTSASDPALEFDAYQRMDTQDDMRIELIAADRIQATDDISWAVGLVQAAAKAARNAGATEVSTGVIDENLQRFIDSATDSTDLLVVLRSEFDRDHSALQHIHRRMLLLIPNTFVAATSWLLAYSGSGRVIEFLTTTRMLCEVEGTAIVAGDDGLVRVHFRDAMEHLANVGYNPAVFELHGNADDVIAAVATVTKPDMLVASINPHEGLRSMLSRSMLPRYAREYGGVILLAVD
ncbi:MAG: hypothetical protein M9953_13225 [Thermomicrobiales bacterium]|nr:hypothetical protein [Thermomicrobiales bacterium]MCO5226293.1 hypothetical protein [Thermomicrobiales bacterium]MCO5228975.1 hypothetical protein [Thermomicrobiales bacterium]